ncbi:hypothetical protein K2173_025292 [Erythroxylum novogranatense]|uniref:PLAC8 family protein n=1 Tax=Erythroxylum novogranatense TaxID=1862640 RepID=A0AAV8UDH1_9ROSI|nr:hypothetical protein K2173_025292 [Erythroxylum novogranatense]
MDQVEKMQSRQSYRNVWHADLMDTIAVDTPYCCFSMFCGPCSSYLLRKRALYNDMSRYVCCAGYCPCSGSCGEKNCPEFCLCTEVFCCFSNSVASTRFLLQDEFNIQTTKCDNCIIGFMFCLQQLACICSIVACITGIDDLEELAMLLNRLADMVFCTVCACIQTQHKLEMDKRDGKLEPRPVMGVPPVQQMSRLAQPPPPPVPLAYASHPPPPPPPYAQYPPGQPQGYPPPGYPPHGYPQPYMYPPPHGYPQTQPYPPPTEYSKSPVTESSEQDKRRKDSM